MSEAVLYSFRRCPYAIRARLAIAASNREVELREVDLKNKPASMLAISAKGTVPVLQLGDEVIDESLDVMRWALQTDNDDSWCVDSLNHPLVAYNDGEFKDNLDRYKYYDRYPEQPQSEYLKRASVFLAELEEQLRAYNGYLLGLTPQAVDWAIFPFVRQLAMVDMTAFQQLPFARLQQWLQHGLSSELFAAVMYKYAAWQEGQKGVRFAGKHAPPVVEHDLQARQFRIKFKDGSQAQLHYKMIDNHSMDITSTRVPTAHCGKGLAAKLVDAAEHWAKSQQWRLHASCWYAAKRLQLNAN